jgi:hypothetical protein
MNAAYSTGSDSKSGKTTQLPPRRSEHAGRHFVSFEQPIIRPNKSGVRPSDVPSRVVVWGLFHLRGPWFSDQWLICTPSFLIQGWMSGNGMLASQTCDYRSDGGESRH